MNESKKWKKQNRKAGHLSGDGTFWTRLELRCVQRCTQHRKLQNWQIFDKKNWQRKCQKKGPGFCEYHRLPSTGFPGSRERSTRVTHMVQTRGIERKDPSRPPRINAIDITAIYDFLFVNNVQPYSIRTANSRQRTSTHSPTGLTTDMNDSVISTPRHFCFETIQTDSICVTHITIHLTTKHTFWNWSSSKYEARSFSPVGLQSHGRLKIPVRLKFSALIWF